MKPCEQRNYLLMSLLFADAAERDRYFAGVQLFKRASCSQEFPRQPHPQRFVTAEQRAHPHFKVVFAGTVCRPKIDRPASTRLALSLHARVADFKLSRSRHIFSRAVKPWDKFPRGRQRAHVYEVRVSVAKEKVYAGPGSYVLTQQSAATKPPCACLKRRRAGRHERELRQRH